MKLIVQSRLPAGADVWFTVFLDHSLEHRSSDYQGQSLKAHTNGTVDRLTDRAFTWQ